MTFSLFTGRPSVQVSLENTKDHLRQIAQGVNRLIRGHGNWTMLVTLTASAATTAVSDARISASTFAGMMPQTAHAAAEIAGGALFVVCTNGSLTISHANNAETDRTFTMSLIG